MLMAVVITDLSHHSICIARFADAGWRPRCFNSCLCGKPGSGQVEPTNLSVRIHSLREQFLNSLMFSGLDRSYRERLY